MNYSLRLLEDKILNKLDYDFINSIKSKFPTNNAYFLVCLSEVVYNSNNYEDSEVLDEIIKTAYELYKKADISLYLNDL